MSKNVTWSVALFVSLVACPLSAAERLSVDAVPEPLRTWVPWALDGQDEHLCPRAGEAAVCLWPGRLNLDLDAAGGSFSQELWVDAPRPVGLPGDAAHWPQAVTLDGKPATVLDVDGLPVVALAPGAHRLAGRFLWPRLPEGLPVPPATGIVTLALDGEPVARVRRAEDGRVWLRASAGSEATESLDVEVTRRIDDGVPPLVTTRIVLRASGRPREIDLGDPRLVGTEIMSLSADVPARFGADGGLRVQVQAGTHVITVGSRAVASFDAFSAGPVRASWPKSEIWVLAANDALRQVTPTGVPGIDPARTKLIDEWRSLPAFLVEAGRTLKLETVRRGQPSPPPDRLTLDRELWLDLDGGGITVRDVLGGTLSRTSRLDLLVPGAVLGHVRVDGEDRLVTRSPGGPGQGVELRQVALDLVSEWRRPGAARTLPAVGWSADVQSLGATLHLPPGWSLLHATGVDELSGTWLSDWNLFGFFFVLLVAVAVGRLTRWPWGLVALVMLLVSHQEADAPYFAWLGVLSVLALVKVLPAGGVRVAAVIGWWVAVAALAVVAMIFFVGQVRGGLFPQVLEPEPGRPPVEPFEASKAEAVQALPKAADGADVRQAAEEASVPGWSYGSRSAKSRKVLAQAPEAVVQTGPGVPTWSWRSWRLGWSGPVERTHTIRLVLLSPEVNLALALLRVLLVALVALRLVYEGTRGRRAVGPLPTLLGGTTIAGAAVLLALLTASPGLIAAPLPDAPAPPALVPQAAGPDQQALSEPLPPERPMLLEELAGRLTRPPGCAPACASISRLELAVSDDRLRLVAEVHAAVDTSLPLPGPAQSFVPDAVRLDGRDHAAVVLRDDGFLHVRIPAGRHLVEAAGVMPNPAALTLELALMPHRVSVVAPGYRIEGLKEDGRAESSVQLLRETPQPDAPDGATNESIFAPWLEITRVFDIGMPWTVETTVRRVSPTGTPVLVKLPLLPGEAVTDARLQVQDGQVAVSLGRDETELSWSSTLAERPRLELVAAEDRPWSERWVLGCSPVWQCRPAGLAPFSLSSDGRQVASFAPWPGEKLVVAFIRPEATAGQSVTVDAATLVVEPGVRLLTATLDLLVRTSRGGTLPLVLPDGARVQELSSDAGPMPLRDEGARLTLNLVPGSQRLHLVWQQAGGIATLQRAPAVRLGGGAVNARVTLRLPSDRWLLFAGGPSWGPAVLFWGYLLVVLFVGFLLGRIPRSPLKSHEWMLLGVGLTQLPAVVTVVVGAWFFLIAWRRRAPLERPVPRNIVQVALIVLSVAALGCFYAAVHLGLLVQPDMQVAGAGSHDTELSWYVDRVAEALPVPFVVSVSHWFWKLLMLAWSLWLAFRLIGWLTGTWQALSEGGFWKRAEKKGR